MNLETLLKRPEVKKWATKIIVGFIGILVIREIIVLCFFNTVFNQVTTNLNEQDQAMAKLHQNMEGQMKVVEKGMNTVMHDVEQGTQELQTKFEAMQQEFAEAPEKIRKSQAFMDYDLGAEAQKSMIRQHEDAEATMQRMADSFDQDIKSDNKKKLAAFIKSIQPSIACEKKLYGKSTFNSHDPYAYHAFSFGLPEQCKQKK